MNLTRARPGSASGWLRLAVLGSLALVLALIVVAPLLIPAAIYLSLRPTGDLRALQFGLAQSTGVKLDRQMEVAVRPTAFALVRAGAALTDVPEEARAALRAIRGVEVGLYQVASVGPSGRFGSVFGEIDRAMARRGWERIVGVVDGRDVVAVFAPQEIPSPRDLSLAVLVFEGSQVVLASVRGDPEALLELALEQVEHHPIPRLARGR